MAAADSRRSKSRADALLVSRGLADSRGHAQALVLAGRVFSAGRRVEKAGQQLRADAPLDIEESPRFVSRGGDKLAGALDAFGLDVAGVVALDVGASTGGFTDCLLQRGAVRSYAVDAGYGQLAAGLRADPRVSVMERTNARHPFTLPEPVDLVVADVSFISLRLVLPPSLPHLRPGGHILALVKAAVRGGQGQGRQGRRGQRPKGPRERCRLLLSLGHRPGNSAAGTAALPAHGAHREQGVLRIALEAPLGCSASLDSFPPASRK